MFVKPLRKVGMTEVHISGVWEKVLPQLPVRRMDDEIRSHSLYCI